MEPLKSRGDMKLPDGHEQILIIKTNQKQT